MLYILFIIIVALDQITKYFAVDRLMGEAPLVIVNNFLQFNYVENFGAAFGILQNKQWFFIILTILIVLGIIIFIKTNKTLTKLMRVCLVMILAGAIGNFIDRIRLGYVVDFIDVKFGSIYDYPVFNIADSSIVIATIIVAYLILTDKYELSRNE